MMKWSIVADTSCDMYKSELGITEIGFVTIPFTIRIDDMDYIDDESLSISEFLDKMERGKSGLTTACPSPGQWADAFNSADQTIAITISSALSGSHGSANVARNMVLRENPGKKILLLDSKSTGPAMALCIRKLKEWVEAGHSIEGIAELAGNFIEKTNTVFALCSFDNLVKNGRINSIMGFLAKKLGLWGVGIDNRGELLIKGKTRGRRNALGMILDDMMGRGYCGGDVAINHCQNEGLAMRLKSLIQEQWGMAKVTIRPTRGLDSFYAERGGLIVAYMT